MPSHLKQIGRYGNGIGVLFFASLALYALSHGDIVVTLFWSMIGALAGFNAYMFSKFAVAEEDNRLIIAEPHTAELRRQLSGLAGRSPETVVRNHGP